MPLVFKEQRRHTIWPRGFKEPILKIVSLISPSEGILVSSSLSSLVILGWIRFCISSRKWGLLDLKSFSKKFTKQPPISSIDDTQFPSSIFTNSMASLLLTNVVRWKNLVLRSWGSKPPYSRFLSPKGSLLFSGVIGIRLAV